MRTLREGFSWIGLVVLAACSGGGAADKVAGPPTIVSVQFAAMPDSLVPGQTLPLSATVTNSLGVQSSGVGVLFTSDDPAIATMSGTTLTAIAVGRANLHATVVDAPSVTATASIRVGDAVVARLSLTAPVTGLALVGDTMRVTGRLFDAANHPRALDALVQWKASPASAGTVVSVAPGSVLVRGLADADVWVIATRGTVQDSMRVSFWTGTPTVTFTARYGPGVPLPLQTAVNHAFARLSRAFRSIPHAYPFHIVNLPTECGFSTTADTTITNPVIAVLVHPFQPTSFPATTDGAPCAVASTAPFTTSFARLYIDSTFASSAAQGGEQQDNMDRKILHQLLHGLGFGTTSRRPDVGLTTGLGGTTPAFTGSLAVAEWNRAGGLAFAALRRPVPLEVGGVDWARDGFYSPSQFASDAFRLSDTMTILGGDVLSRITLALFADLGYDMRLGAGDKFTVVTPIVQH